ncbi:MAG: hypothetical protein V5A44_09385 [Haloarculaceae archaeon]
MCPTVSVVGFRFGLALVVLLGDVLAQSVDWAVGIGAVERLGSVVVDVGRPLDDDRGLVQVGRPVNANRPFFYT